MRSCSPSHASYYSCNVQSLYTCIPTHASRSLVRLIPIPILIISIILISIILTPELARNLMQNYTTLAGRKHCSSHNHCSSHYCSSQNHCSSHCELPLAQSKASTLTLIAGALHKLTVHVCTDFTPNWYWSYSPAPLHCGSVRLLLSRNQHQCHFISAGRWCSIHVTGVCSSYIYVIHYRLYFTCWNHTRVIRLKY